MRPEAVVKRKTHAITQLRDVYSAARFYGATHTELCNKVQAIRATTLNGCPHWAIAEFNGYDHALSDNLYQTSLMFGGFVDGVFYSTHSDRPDYYGKNGIEPRDYADNGRVVNRGHYWTTTKEPKMFFIPGLH